MNKKTPFYHVGLDTQSEAVISAHFMHAINQHPEYQLYSAKTFIEKAHTISASVLLEKLIPSLIKASDDFIKERVLAAKKRASKNFHQYVLSSPEQITLSEIITEVIFDRQFLKGSKSNASKIELYQKIKKLVVEEKPIKMVVLGLPYKSSSPLKSRGWMPDFAELNFLISLSEIAKTIDYIYRKENITIKHSMSKFTIVSDGSRFNHFLHERTEDILRYQEKLHEWVKILNLSEYIEIKDYQEVMLKILPKHMQLEKNAIKNRVKNVYRKIMEPIFDPVNIMQSIQKAIELDPDPEMCNLERRFIPLFKSLIYIVNYTSLKKHAHTYHENYIDLYTMLTKHIFEPYASNILVENLRQAMLKEAWDAAIDYISEIRSDRDLDQEPISTCFPEHLRWTIHAKPGQLAVLTTTSLGDPVQPWHGIGVFKKTKKNKIKLYTLPVLLLEGIHATPIILENTHQPLFYVYPDIQFDNIEDLVDKIKSTLTRKRKD